MPLLINIKIAIITKEEIYKVLIGLRAKSFASQEEKSQTSWWDSNPNFLDHEACAATAARPNHVLLHFSDWKGTSRVFNMAVKDVGADAPQLCSWRVSPSLSLPFIVSSICGWWCSTSDASCWTILNVVNQPQPLQPLKAHLDPLLLGAKGPKN